MLRFQFTKPTNQSPVNPPTSVVVLWVLGVGISARGAPYVTRTHRKPVERFKQGRECNGSLKASEHRRERYRLFFVVLLAVVSGGKFYHIF